MFKNYMFPFLLPFLPPTPQPRLLALSYLSSLIFNHFLYQMCSPSKPNSFLFPRRRPFGFLPLDLGSFVMVVKWCSSVRVQPKHLHPREAPFDFSSCFPQIRRHPKVGVTFLSQQFHCVAEHLLLYHVRPSLARLLFWAPGLFLLLSPLSARTLSRTRTQLAPFLHSGLCCLLPPWSPHLTQGLLLPTYAVLTPLVRLHGA